MKKYSLFKFTSTILFLVIGLCIAAVFTSCENFLKGAETKRQLEEAIAFANAEECTLFVKSDAKFGSFLSAGEKKCKVGYTTELQFTVNQESYKFVGLEAVSTSDNSQSRGDLIEFTLNQKESNENEGIYKYTVKLLKSAADILIRPVCLAYPKITQVTPTADNTVISFTPIVIKFNIPMENDDGTSPLSTLDNISITMSGESFKNYFSSAILNQEKTALTIIPDYSKLNDCIEKTEGVPYITLNISLKDVVLIKNGVELPVKGGDSEITVQYKAGEDTEQPVIVDWFMTRYEITPETGLTLENDKKFIKKTADAEDFMDDAVYANLAEEYVYLWGKVYDKDSGLKKITVKQHRDTYNISSSASLWSVKDSTTEFIIGGDNMQNLSDDKGNTIFCIKIDIVSYKNAGGEVLFDIMLEDGCENKQKGNNLTISGIATTNSYNNSTINYNRNFNVTNSPENPSRLSFSIPPASTSISYQVLFAFYDKYQDDSLTSSYHGFISGRKLKYECKYVDKNGTTRIADFVKADNSDTYSVQLENFDENNLEKQTFTVLLKYDKYLLWTCKYNFPRNPFVQTITENNGTKTIKFSTMDRASIHTKKSTDSGFSNKTELALSNDYDVYVTASNNGIYGNMIGPFTLNSVYGEKPSAPVLKGRTLKPQKTGYLDIILDVEASDGNGISKKWDEVYDSLFLEYSYYWFNETKGINKGCECSVTVTTESMYDIDNYNPKVKITGIKNNKVSDTVEYNIRFADDKERIDNDNILPQFSLKWVDENSFKLFCKDEQSGPESGTVNIGNNTFKMHPSEDNAHAGEYEALISVDLFRPNIKNYTYILKDKAGNTTSGIKSMDMRPFVILRGEPKYTVGTDNWTPNFNKNAEPLKSVNSASDDRAVLYYYVLENNFWGTQPAKTFERTGYDLIIPDNTDFSVNKDKYVKILYIYSDDNKHFDNYEVYYTGDYSGNSEKNMLFFNGSDHSSLVVSSDAPVLVHTLVTTHSYNECKEWSVAQWETFPKEIEIKQFDIPSTGGLKRYDIPANLVNDGECYVVIAHYADGSAQKSEVMQQ